MLAITVDTPLDVVDANDGLTSLREAIVGANANPGDTISFDASVFNGETGDMIRLDSQLPAITANVTIDATGTTEVVISGDVLGDDSLVSGAKLTDVANTAVTELDDNVRLLEINSGATVLIGLTLTGGRTTADFFHGGAIRSNSSSDLVIKNSTVSGNSTIGWIAYGGAIFSSGPVTLTGSVVSGNSTANNGAKGGAIFAGNVTLTDSTLSGNSTTGGNADGGGIFSSSATITNSTVSGNSTAGFRASGGGIQTGTAILLNSTLSGNSTTNAESPGGGLSALGTVNLTNSTVSSNTTTLIFSEGAGIFSQGNVTLANSTITLNTAGNPAVKGGGLHSVGNVDVSNSIVAGNSSNGGSDIFLSTTRSPTITARFSLIGTNNGNGIPAAPTPDGNGNLIGTTGALLDPKLGPLANNGGPTQTHKPLTDSPAVSAGDPSFDPSSFTPALVNDQRGNGFPRVGRGSGRLDMGAVEREPRNIVVDLARDESDGDVSVGDLSLREAIELANADADPNLGVRITFDPTVFNGEAADVIRLGSQLPSVAKELVIDGSTATEVVVSGDSLGDDTLVTGTKLTDLSATALSELDDNVRLLDVTSGSTIFVGLTLTGGRVFRGTGGAAIRSLGSGSVSLVDTVVSGNSTHGNNAYGGGITAVGAVTLTGSTVSDNSTSGFNSAGGGIFAVGAVTLNSSTVSGNSTIAGRSGGGGIYSRANVSLFNSTVSGNSTAGVVSAGGGISSGNLVTLTNSTVSGNDTRSSDSRGGGIFAGGGVTSTSSTVSGNATTSASVPGGGVSSGGNVTLTSSIVAGNTSNGTVPDIQLVDPTTSSVTATYSLIGSNNGNGLTEAQTPDAVGNLVGTTGRLIDPKLAPLASNGGPTQTHALLTQSPAVDAGDPSFDANAFTPPLTNDQRGSGFQRVLGRAIDIGAFESSQVTETPGLTVDIAADTFDRFDNKTSLREAIYHANLQSGADTLRFDTTVFNGEYSDVIRLQSQLPSITEDLTLDATSTTEVVVSGDVLGDDTPVAGTKLTDLSQTATTELNDNIRVFDITAGATTFVGLTITGGRTTGTNETGAGINSASSSDLTITNSTVHGNSTTRQGGLGGGIRSVGNVRLNNSTVSGNLTTAPSTYGGGLVSLANAFISNSTVSGNSTLGFNSKGGGVFTVGDVSLANSTVSGNTTSAAAAIGGGVYSRSGNVTLSNSIVAGNTSTAAGPDLFSPTPNVTASYSLIGSNVGNGLIEAKTPDGSGNLIGGPVLGLINPLLGPLSDNGGLTRTHGLLPGSPAINAGDPSAVAGVGGIPTFDQRGTGFGRVQDARIDMGAFELDVPSPLVVSTLNDLVDGNYTSGNLSLREAIAFANINPAPDVITFDASLAGGTIRLVSQLPAMTGSITVDASAATGVVITGDVLQNDNLVTGSKLTDLAATSAANLADNVRIFTVRGGATFKGLTLTGGRAVELSARGGAINSQFPSALEVFDSTISGNSTVGTFSAQGGGIFAEDDLILANSTVSGNSTEGPFGGGGGLFSNGKVMLTNSTVSGNTTKSDSSSGGGISGSNGVEVTNSTVSGNSTTGNHSSGGGITGRLVTLSNSTVTGNSTSGLNSEGGGIGTSGNIIISNSIVAGNTSVSGAPDIFQPNFSNPALTVTYSLIGSNQGANLTEAPTPDGQGNLIGGPIGGVIDAMLAPLADNGGSTQMHALMSGSPAINGGNPGFNPNDFIPALTNDQRGLGFDRVSGGRLDMGAFEAQFIPQVESVIVDNDGDLGCTQNCQRSMVRKLTVYFDAEVTIDSAAFSITNAATNEAFTIADADVLTSIVDGKTVAMLTFTNSTNSLTGGSLADGNYRFAVDSSRVRAGSNAMASNHVDEFFRFFGDHDGDRDVDARDYVQFRRTYLRNQGDRFFNSAFDSDGDGDIDALDFVQFRRRYLRSLPTP